MAGAALAIFANARRGVVATVVANSAFAMELCTRLTLHSCDAVGNAAAPQNQFTHGQAGRPHEHGAAGNCPPRAHARSAELTQRASAASAQSAALMEPSGTASAAAPASGPDRRQHCPLLSRYRSATSV